MRRLPEPPTTPPDPPEEREERPWDEYGPEDLPDPGEDENREVVWEIDE